ncbi:MAG: hypothetical protein JKX94_11175 [Sneathiella sp.]|nr:hypothetical protein [Sneathiella sp.]
MFNRNEKYGQALHLAYGYEHNVAYRSTTPKNGLLAKLKSAFAASTVSEQIENLNATVEIALDRKSIEQAVTAELRNSESAANENQLELIQGKIA